MKVRPDGFSVRAIAALGVFLATGAAARARQAQTIELESLKISIDADWASRAAPGYFPARFDITNGGDARDIQIVGQGSRTYMSSRGTPGMGSTSIRQTVQLAAGDHVRLTIAVPIYGDSESMYFEIREAGRMVTRFNYTGLQSRIPAADAAALIVATPGGALDQLALRTVGMAPGYAATGRGTARSYSFARGGPSAALDFRLEPSRLPANWLGYTSLRAVVLGTEEWSQLNDGQRSALLGWNASGGDLIFVDGDITALLPTARPQTSADTSRVTARHLFGRVHAVSLSSVQTGLAGVLAATAPEREPFLALPANGAPDWGAIEKAGFRLRIPGVEGVPARAYLGILFLFSLVIGPANYWLLRRKRRQPLVVLTAPAISAAFILLLTVYAVVGEGFRVLGRADTVTVLDQRSKQAATRASASLYAAGLTPSGGLRFGRDVAVWAVGTDGTGVRDRLDMDLTEAQQFSSGVLQARSPTNFDQVVFRTARERLTFSRSDGGLTVTNGLDATVVALVYRDERGTYALDGRLANGSQQEMRAGAFDPSRAQTAGVMIPARHVGLFRDPPAGAYVALLDRSPFWEPGVPRLVERGSVHVVIGWPEGQR